MYEKFFGFRRRPFVSVPDVELYYPGETIEAARQTLVRCIERGEGPGLLLGPSGSGKTLLCKLLANHFAKRMPVALLCAGRLGSRLDLLRTLLYELGQPYRGLDEGEARIAMVDYLTSVDDSAPGVLVLVDEAQTLPLRLLDELRMLGNLHAGTAPVPRMVLAGGMTLEEHLANPKLECLSQRITGRCYLEPFDGGETAAYIGYQVDAVRRSHQRHAVDLFDKEAVRAVFHATDGVPRLVNQICDRALLLTYNRGESAVSAEDVEEAWAELQQLPSPWSDEPSETSGGVIEFGSLDDEAEGTIDSEESSDDSDERPRLQILKESRDESRPRPLSATVFISDDEETAGSERGKPGGARTVRALNPFAEIFEVEEIVAPRSATIDSVFNAIEPCPPPSPSLPLHKAATCSRDEIEPRGLPERAEACNVNAGVRPARPVAVAFSPGFPLPEFSWPDPQYGHSPLPRSTSIRGPVPGTGHLKRPG